jgi:hypothetical protein
MTLANPQLEKIDELLEVYTSKKRLSSDGNQSVYLSYDIKEDDVTIYENLPDSYETEKIAVEPLAQITFDNFTNRWKVFFLKPDPGWHAYEPQSDPEVSTFAEALNLIHRKSKGWYL